ncbi:MAG: hypothetical protein AAGD00_06415 [Planctomycetota bacterium]
MTLATIAPVWLDRAAPAAEQASGAPVVPTSVWIAVGVCAALGVALALLWRMGIGQAPEDHAFRALCRKLRVPRRGRALVRRLAESIEAPAIALLLSEAAFVRARARASEGLAGWYDEHAASDVHRKVFAPR